MPQCGGADELRGLLRPLLLELQERIVAGVCNNHASERLPPQHPLSPLTQPVPPPMPPQEASENPLPPQEASDDDGLSQAATEGPAARKKTNRD